jgi:hypothetical protein
MEFHPHSPKLWHGWREFLREYVVVVVGVLTAAAVTLALEGLRQRHEVADARRAIRFEIARNANLALDSIEEERCRVGMFNLTIAWLDHGGPRPQFNSSSLQAPRGDSAWEVAKTGGIAHMPFEERLAYSNFYEFLDGQHEVLERDRNAAVQAVGLGGRTELTAADKQALRDLIAQQRILGELRTAVATAMVSQAKAMGIAPPPISADRRAALNAACVEDGMTPPFSG